MYNRNKRKFYWLMTILLLIFIPFISIGYSALQSALEIRGDVTSLYIYEGNNLFLTLENLEHTGTCMTKYNGEVTDSVGVTTTATNVYFDKCENQRNVIFGGFCWQVIRTTENGGTKLLYNGEPDGGKCESTRGDHKGIIGSYGSVTSLSAEYLYGSTFTYDTTNNNFTLVDTQLATWNNSTYENLIGKYTCKNTTGTCTTLYNINSASTSTHAYSSSHTISTTNYAQIGTNSYNNNL